jgi:transcriptional regulator with XRE-family HTH domain
MKGILCYFSMDDRQISERIRAIRQQQEIPQRVVAEALHMDQSNYSRRETGDRSFSGGEIAQFCQVAKIDIKKIFY